MLNKSSRYEVVRVQTVWTLRRRHISCASACNRIATLRTAQSQYLLRHHASVSMSLTRLDCSDGRNPHGSIRTKAEIQTRDPSVLAVTRR